MTTDNIERLYELSPMQQGMLFHTLYAPHSGVYIEQFVCMLEGRLNAQFFSATWQHSMLRHPPLRTAFIWEDMDDPLQVVYHSVPLPWQEQDWRALSESERRTSLEALLASDRTQGFDLARAPLLRLTLLRLSDEVSYFVCTYHHILLDGWSLVAVLQEVFSLYETLRSGREPLLVRRRPFEDYIAWLRQRKLDDARTFWGSYLQGFTAPTPLPIADQAWQEEAASPPADRGDEVAQDNELPGGYLHGGRPVRLSGFTLPAEEAEALRHCARSYQLTVNTLLQGAWAILLSRYSGEQDIVFGSTVAGRPADLAGSEQMIGLFINTLPVRVQVSPQLELHAWLKQLQEQQAEARQYDYSPLVQVQGWSDVPRDLSLFESLFVFENYPVDTTSGANESQSLRIAAVQSLEQTNYPLVFVVGSTGTTAQGLKLQLGYETARFSSAVIERLLSHLRSILDQMVQHPTMRLGDIALWEEEAQQQLLKEWNGPRTYDDNALTIVDAVRRQALRVPERVALVCGERTLIYAELERRSNRLAHHLRNLGIGSEICVAVCLDRSAEVAIALLGILKSGGFYLPLDPGFPQERLAFMLSETQAPVVLTRTTYQHLFAAMDVQTLCVEVECLCPTNVDDTPPAGEIQPAQAAYVIYTSGSTGRPKGVIVSHKALLNHARAVDAAYTLRERERVLQFASMSFDVSLEEFLPAWVCGASVVMWPETLPPSAPEFSAFIAREALGVLNVPSSYWHEWVLDLARTRAALPSSLRLVVIGSERASAARLALWQRVVGERVALRNAYGLTETTITALVSTPGWISAREETCPVPVGRPLANVEAYVLDDRWRPVPAGVPGELYIGGACLGRGYLANAAQTAERFLPHPFSATPGVRLYRTGDRARYLPDGELEVLGRSDGQVKIRGFRIEPAEVEARLLQYPSIREALILAREDTPGEVQLVAYIVVDEQRPALVTQLRQHLQQHLPQYMVPTFFVLLDALPRTSGGKVNVQSLPDPQQALTRSDAYVPPRTPVEEMLAAIWCDVLRLELVGRMDHFFKLGGHSLQATQVIARLRETLRIEVPVRALYDAPTIAALAARIEQERRRTTGRTIPAIEPVERGVPLPLSFAQQRLWFLNQFQPDNPFYTLPGMLYLRGSLDVASLERSLQDLVQRHETLRTTFVLREGKPTQVIALALLLSLPVIQLSGNAGLAWHEELINRLGREEAQQPFDLERGPLIRTLLLRLNPQEHVLLLTLHHIIADGWAMEILLQELSAFYTANLSGQPATVSPLPIQYADYAAWQRSWLQGHELDQQLAYWRRQLEGVPTHLALPTDRPRPALQTYNGALYPFHLELSLTRRLHTLSHEEGVTLFMTLLAAFQAFLFRYSNQTDIVVGTPTSGRVHHATESVVGLFLNMLPLRTQLRADQTYRELLQEVRDVTLGAYTHQDVPFEKVVEELQPERSLSYSPLFQVMLVLQNMPISAIALPGLSLEVFGAESTTSKFDLTLGMRETPHGLHCVMEYTTDLFDEATIARMAGHFQTLLEGCVAAPHFSLIDLPLLTPGERQQILREWNTDSLELSTHCVHHLFEENLRIAPDKLALTFAEEQLTYAGLDQRANRLAHYLQSLGVGPDTLVGLFLARSIDQIVAILAVLKAGGAYVPLDPAYPQERLAFMLEDAAVTVLVAHEALRPLLPVLSGPVEVYLDRDQIRQQINCYPTTPPPAKVLPEHLAYVMYTSGSTGRSRGVMVTHRSVCNHAQALARRFGEQADARVLQWISLSFDASLSEIATTFQVGATLCLGDREQLQQGEELLTFLEREAITTLMLASSVLALMPQKALPHLRTIAVGAEPFSGELVARWSVGRRFFNNYGPTEATVTATVSECRGSDQPSIGQPLANVQVYLLDANLQPVPIGVPGELYIGGLGLARGYHQQPALTAERFIPHPFSTLPGMRLYRTGDLARYRSDGAIEFLGRIDRQVKVRGHRIEPGEIEASLDQYPAIHTSAVVVREDIPGNRQLVAYIVSASELPLVPAEIRTYLRQRLPAYMIPAAIVSLPALPLTSNGKLDHAALPAPTDGDAGAQDRQDSLPRTPLQEVLAAIWSDLLHREQIGITQNFFDLGGHSLLATQVISRIRELLHIDIPLRALFETPTLADLATLIEAARGDSSQAPEVPPLTPRPAEITPPLSYAQERLWFLHQLEPANPAYHVPVMLRVQGAFNREALQESLNALVQRHEILRTTFAMINDQPRQIVAPRLEITIQTRDLQHAHAEEQQQEMQRQAVQEIIQPFDLGRGPLVRALLLRLSEYDHILLLTLHHSVTDGWSTNILINELDALYRAISIGKPYPLAALPIQYADFATWQRQWLQGEELERQVAYWRQQLRGAPAVLDLPADHPRPPARTYRGDASFFALSPTLSRELELLSRRQAVTLFMTLLAAFKVLLMRYSGQTDIVVGTPIAGRTRGETEGLVGFFINTLALRTNLADNPTFRTLLARVREVCLEAYTHQDAPFEKVIEAVQPERNLSHHPIFQVMFILQNAPLGVQFMASEHDQSLALRPHPLALGEEATKFDLTVELVESPEGLHGSVEYTTDVFERATIERLIHSYQQLLAGIVASPDEKLSLLPLLDEVEQRRLLYDWNETPNGSIPELRVQQLFEKQVACSPEKIALVYEDAGGASKTLTYAELNWRANQLAHLLRARGVQPEGVVGVYLERSPEMMVALLGVLKAGGAYVPLDPTHPAERLALMLHETQAPILLTHQRLLPKLPPYGGLVINLDDNGEELAGQDAGNLPNEATATNLAYVIYTSGSTGLPKGVMITHGGLTNYLLWSTRAYSMEQGQGSLAHSSLASDLSVTTLFAPLLVGQRLTLLAEDQGIDALGNAIAQARDLSLVKLTPAHLTLLAGQLAAEDVAGRVRAFIIGGEALLREHVAFWQAHAPETRLINEYGPTETVVGCSVYELPASSQPSNNRTVPIGRPIANTHIYLLDQELQPVPTGVPGEVYIAGAGVARGYLQRPDLTAERFLPNPFSKEPGGRMYRTGDLARSIDAPCVSNGVAEREPVIEFLGRNDAQVKLRGYRVELGEIEAALKGHPGVQEAVVLLEEGTAVPGERRFIAYLVAQPGAALAPAEARTYLRARLPEYMVPAFYVMLDGLPLLSNGKIDRRALAALGQSTQLPEHGNGEPRDPVEEALISIWAEVLGRTQIGIYDNFFELGGHSLLITRVISRVRRDLQVEIPLRTLFEAPTIADFARAIMLREFEAADDDLLLQMLEQFEEAPEDGRAVNTVFQEGL